MKWDCDVPIKAECNPDLLLYLARPAVLRMTLAENLALLSDADTMGSAREIVSNVPLLKPEERIHADEMLDDKDMSISDRARYAAVRVFMSNRPVVLVDMFFNLMELEDQVAFVKEFKARFPDRILLINASTPRSTASPRASSRLEGPQHEHASSVPPEFHGLPRLGLSGVLRRSATLSS